MPLNKKGDKILRAMVRKYGKKKGTRVFYASENKGTITGVTKAAQGKVIPGPGLVQVGEGGRSEYAFLMPGSIVAPMRKGEKPTMAGGLRAVLEQLFKTVPASKPRGAQGGFTAYPTGVNALLNRPRPPTLPPLPTGTIPIGDTRSTARPQYRGDVLKASLESARSVRPGGGSQPWATIGAEGSPGGGRIGQQGQAEAGMAHQLMYGSGAQNPSGMRGLRALTIRGIRGASEANRRRLMGMQYGGEVEGNGHLPYGWQPKPKPTPKPAVPPATPASANPTLPIELMNLPFLQRLMGGRRTSLLQTMAGTAQPFGAGVEMPNWQGMNYYDYLKNPEYQQQMTQAIASAFGMPPEQAIEQSRRATGVAYGTPLQRGFVAGRGS